jgi:hypothetical protein
MKINVIRSWIKNEVKWICAKLEENASVQTEWTKKSKKFEKITWTKIILKIKW